MIEELLKPETQKFLEEHAQEDPAHVSLKYRKVGDTPIRLIVNQLISRQKASKKFPGWSNFNLIYPNPIAVEQASSEITAEYKASLFSGNVFIDLTGGLGVDTIAFSKKFTTAIYVEPDPDKAAAAKYNFRCLGIDNIEVVNSTAEEFINRYQQRADLIYLDPDRRPNAERVQSLKDSAPDVVQLQDKLLKMAGKVAIKASPMLDISAITKQLKFAKEVHVIASNNECKELLFILQRQQEPGAAMPIVAANFSFGEWSLNSYGLKELDKAVVGLPQNYLYEPNAAILKAAIQDAIAIQLKIKKLHPSTQLFTSEERIEFPGRVFKILAVIPVNKKALQKEVPGLKANLSTRNFPEHVDKLKKRLGIKDGGNYYLFACRTADLTYKLIISEKV